MLFRSPRMTHQWIGGGGDESVTTRCVRGGGGFPPVGRGGSGSTAATTWWRLPCGRNRRRQAEGDGGGQLWNGKNKGARAKMSLPPRVTSQYRAPTGRPRNLFSRAEGLFFQQLLIFLRAGVGCGFWSGLFFHAKSQTGSYFTVPRHIRGLSV